jgi:hypothetical protein
MGSCEALFLQIQAYLISHLKLMWYPMLILALLVLGVGFLQNIMNLFLDVLELLNKVGFSITLNMSMGRLFICSCNGKIYINGGQWLEPQVHMKMVVANRVVEGFFVSILSTRKIIIPCSWMFGIVHPLYMDNHHVDYLCFSIRLWVEGS